MKYWLLLGLVLACLYLDLATGCEDGECGCDDDVDVQVVRPTATDDDDPEECDDEMVNYATIGRNERIGKTEYVLNREDRDYYMAQRPNRRVVYTRPKARPAPPPRRQRTYRVRVDPEPEPCQDCDLPAPPPPPPPVVRRPARPQSNVQQCQKVNINVMQPPPPPAPQPNPQPGPRPALRPYAPLRVNTPGLFAPQYIIKGKNSKEKKALKKAKKALKGGSGSGDLTFIYQ